MCEVKFLLLNWLDVNLGCIRYRYMVDFLDMSNWEEMNYLNVCGIIFMVVMWLVILDFDY